MQIPKLVAPAGNLERLKIAVRYGADAVYFAGRRYGLRAAADNFLPAEIEAGVAFAHAHGAEAYVVLNAFLHEEDFDGLASYCAFLEATGVDALVVSDLGVIRAVRAVSLLPIFLSTQASCLNAAAASLWQRAGIRRVILGREVSIAEGGAVTRATGLEVELFLHGAMCMAFSGHCRISNVLADRDANRGGCNHACRHLYKLTAARGSSSRRGLAMASHFLSSKDLCGLKLLERYASENIHSLKIEGRMKSALYVATVCRVYRQALDLLRSGALSDEMLSQLALELEAVPHRDYCEGSLLHPAGRESLYPANEPTHLRSSHAFVGTVLEHRSGLVAVRLFAPVGEGDTLEFLPFRGAPIVWSVSEMRRVTGEAISAAPQESVVLFSDAALSRVEAFNVVRRRLVRTVAAGSGRRVSSETVEVRRAV